MVPRRMHEEQGVNGDFAQRRLSIVDPQLVQRLQPRDNYRMHCIPSPYVFGLCGAIGIPARWPCELFIDRL